MPRAPEHHLISELLTESWEKYVFHWREFDLPFLNSTNGSRRGLAAHSSEQAPLGAPLGSARGFRARLCLRQPDPVVRIIKLKIKSNFKR